MGLWSWFRSTFAGPESRSNHEEKPLVALVLLLSRPRDLDLSGIAHIARTALGERFQLDQADTSGNFVAGEEPSFVLKYHDWYFLVNSFARPYMEDPEAAAETIGELRLRKAIREHSAWISVDLLGKVQRSEMAEIYRVIGRLTSALADGDCLAIFAPATGQLNLYDDDSSRLLCGRNPFELFKVCNHPPVVPVSGNDPRLKVAVAKARKQWPQFVTAFENRHSDQTFSIKARIGNDAMAEFMWVAVTGLENGWIYGRLDNDPIELESIRCGDRVRVHIRELNDWLFTDGDQVKGGFTIDVLRRIQEES
jgi:uncharacterized protein YegJ (DUF2314 family)